MLFKAIATAALLVILPANAIPTPRSSLHGYPFVLSIYSQYDLQTQGGSSENFYEPFRTRDTNGAKVCLNFVDDGTVDMNDKMRSFWFQPRVDSSHMEVRFYQNVNCKGEMYLKRTGESKVNNVITASRDGGARYSSSALVIHHGSNPGI
ncbi:hypothetical protein BV22DRAFT_1124937 [Leucogyrophana mollusca]|uniref:Uncharacterized protein n=1 Tax=Leucogyrophana mollusca TaxID=85980 RepID=A0ACB8C131_9AGAM|nr:hypothetical protein BV22DRAFT_1124937 [Leucogyrophana mollusca]